MGHPCIVERCEEKRQSILYCNAHGKSFKKYGDPLKARGTILCRTLSEYECGRIAAFIDGEGYISASRRFNGSQITVGIGNTNKILTDYLLETLGCGYTFTSNSSPKWKMKYEFSIRRSNDVLYLLYQIQDHLLLKKLQAVWAIELLRIRKENYGRPITDKETYIIKNIRGLNKRGR